MTVECPRTRCIVAVTTASEAPTAHFRAAASVRLWPYHTMNAPAPVYIWQRETVVALSNIPTGCINARSAELGLTHCEPLLVIADSLLRYAKAYRARFDGPISGDGVGSEAFRAMIAGVKCFLDFDGAVALERGITTDSKDNAAMCDVLQAVCDAAGFTWEDI